MHPDSVNLFLFSVREQVVVCKNRRAANAAFFFIQLEPLAALGSRIPPDTDLLRHFRGQGTAWVLLPGAITYGKQAKGSDTDLSSGLYAL